MNALIVLLATIFLAFSCSRGESETQEPPVVPRPGKDPEAAKRLIAGGAVVVDVRTAGEFQSGHLDKAVNVPVDEVGSRIGDIDKLVGGDRGKPVVLYCSKGSRSAKAKQALEAAGYTQVVNGGGLDDLQ